MFLSVSKGSKRFLLLLLFSLSSVVVLAQRGLPPLDFEQFRKDVSELTSSEEKLNRYVQMSIKAMRYRSDSLFTFAKEIEELPGLDPVEKQAFSQFMLANGWRAVNRDSAIYYATKAAEQLKKLGEHEQYLRTKNLLGLEYQKNANYLDAESAYLKALDYSHNIDSAGYPIHYFYGNLGNLYSSVGANNLAIQMFKKFMEYADNAGDRCNIKSRLAKNLMNLNDLEKAEQMLRPCLEYDLPPPIQAITRSNLSEIVAQKGQKEQSLSLMEEAAAISVRYQIPNLHFVHLVRLGNQYLKMQEITKADSIQSLISSTTFRRSLPHNQIPKERFFAELALANSNFADVLSHADLAIQIGEENGLKHLLGDIYEVKSKAYEGMNEMALAVKTMRLHNELREMLDSKEEEKNLTMMQVRYQLKNKENELAFISNQLTILNTRNLLLFGAVIFLLVGGGFIYSRYRKSRSQEEAITSELEKRDVTIGKLEEKIKEQNEKLDDRDIPDLIALNSQVKLSLDEIRYIQSEGNYVKIYLSNTDRAPMMERLTLKECEEKLPDELSLRIHRSTLVNLRHVSHINDQILVLKDDTQLKISRRYKKELINFLN